MCAQCLTLNVVVLINFEPMLIFWYLKKVFGLSVISIIRGAPIGA